MHFLITGGAGFIGSQLTSSLLNEGHEVTAVDNFDPFYPRTSKEKNIQAFRNNTSWRLIEADIRDPQELERQIGSRIPDMILHLAAKAGVRPSLLQPELYHDVNVNGTSRLLELAEKWKIQKFIFASSSSVYGVNPNVPWSEKDTELQPISPYAKTKIEGEKRCVKFAQTTGIPVVALRFFTVFGPGQRPDLAIHRFVKAAFTGTAIDKYGDGSTRRDYTYVHDIVKGILGAIRLPIIKGKYQLFNLGNSNTISLNELIAAVEKATGKKIRINALLEQEGDVPQTFADISQAKADLEYRPSTSLEEGLKEFVNWYKQNLN